MKAGRMSSQLTQLTNRTDNRVHTLILGGVFVSQLALGASDAELSACSAITDKHQRLECYDAAVQKPSGATKSPVVAISDNVDTSLTPAVWQSPSMSRHCRSTGRSIRKARMACGHSVPTNPITFCSAAIPTRSITNPTKPISVRSTIRILDLIIRNRNFSSASS